MHSLKHNAVAKGLLGHQKKQYTVDQSFPQLKSAKGSFMRIPAF